MKVDIYVSVSSAFPQVSEKAFGYVLSTETKNGIQTKEGFGKVESTYHGAVLTAIVEALGRFKVPCEICIYSENVYVMNTLNKIEYWKERGYLNAKGEPMKSQIEWMRIGAESDKHCISCKIERHEYTTWLLGMMEQKEGKNV